MSDASPFFWSVGVVIPARDERDSIGRCIGSILSAHARCARAADLWIVVAADACSDDTAAVARAAIGEHGQVIECNARSPGTARRWGALAVLEHFRSVDRARVWIANTDADTVVPRNWLQRQLQHADEGATAVAGIVELDDSGGLRQDLVDVYRSTYLIGSDGAHGHVHGANLGVRADAYVDVGGFSHLKVAEDHCLWGRLRQRGWRIRSCAKTVVTTSARLQGRAVGGFADTLRRRLERGRG